MSKNFSFGSVPVIRHSRSRQDLSHGVKTSGNVGTLYPFECQEVYPGDTFKVKTSCVSRLSSQYFRPVMDNLFLDVYYFFVPSRLLYDKFVNIFGENTESAWANEQEYEAPYLQRFDVPEKTVADYLGIPPGRCNSKVNILPFRAFAKIYNEWFRDQNNIDPMHVQTGELTASETPNNNPWSSNNYMGQCPKVAKFHDLFTSALPAPQKGAAPSISLGKTAPIISTNGQSGYLGVVGTTGSIHVNAPGTRFPLYDAVTGVESGKMDMLGISDDRGRAAMFANASQSIDLNSSDRVIFSPQNLWLDTTSVVADLSNAGGVTVNDLRFAFAYQRLLEKAARGGSRFVEYIAQNFGVSAGDYRLQRSEFLGGRRTPLSIHQVTQTTGSDTSNPLAAVGAFGLSNSRSRFTKGFTEHGYVIGVYCIRQMHTYQQGVEKFWTRTKRADYYDPTFAHLGEQPVMKTELFSSFSETSDSPGVFGYAEAWYDLRSRQNRVTGQMRSSATDSLDIWHFADEYENAPVLGQAFIEETPDYVDRAITVSHTAQDQFILDFWISNPAYRVIPTFSVPSLIDHD